MNNELDDFVGNDEVDTDATVETTAESQEEEAQAESSPLDTSEKGETDAPPASTDKPQETMVPLAAKQAEKERRKQAEYEAQQYRAQLEAMQRQQQQKPRPDPYTDPENYTQTVLSERENAQLRARLASSEEMARVEYSDYDEYADYFAEVVAPNNPQLVQQMMYAPDPAKYAYLKGRHMKQESETQAQIAAAGGLEAWRRQIEEQAVANAMANVKKSPDIPPDLSSVRNAGSDPKAEQISDGTDGLRELLGR